jgi:uncharacterized protein (DUF1778 family)
MAMKSEHVQIRVRPDQKVALRQRAEQAGLDLSSYVLSRVLPTEASRFEELLLALRDEDVRTHALAELNDLLTNLSTRQLREVVADADVEGLSDVTGNYVAAMVEHACHGRGADAPAWTRRVIALEEPFFAVPLRSLRLHLLRSSPVAFKRRNIFIDSTLGDRV